MVLYETILNEREAENKQDFLEHLRNLDCKRQFCTSYPKRRAVEQINGNCPWGFSSHNPGQILFMVGMGKRAISAEIPLGCANAPHARRQRGASAGPTPTSAKNVPDGSPVNYWFKTGVVDEGRGFMQGRAETKQGDQVVGSYEYSDGHVKVKVVYTADERGYRVVKEERVTLKPFIKNEIPFKKSNDKRRPVSSKHRNKDPYKSTHKVKNIADGKYSSSYAAESSQGLVLANLEGYDVKMSTDHLTGFSQQGFSSQAASEIYRDETFFNNAPRFRDASEFDSAPSASDSVLVSFEGLQPNQHGFMIVNPQYSRRQQVNNQQLTNSQKETVRRQEDFVRGVLETNKARINQQNQQSGVRATQPTFTQPFGTQNRGNANFQKPANFQGQQSQPLTPTNNFQRPNSRPAVNIANRPLVDQRGFFQQELVFNQPDLIIQRTTPSPFLQTNDFASFQQPATVQNNQPTFNEPTLEEQPFSRIPSFSFREASTSRPDTTQDFSNFGQVIDSTKTNSRRPDSARISEGQINQFLQKTQTNSELRRPSFTIKSPARERPVHSEREKHITRQRVNFVSLEQTTVAPPPPPPPPPKIDFQDLPNGEDEESKFISQVNQNTASFVTNSGAASVSQDEAGIFEQVLPQQGPTDFQKPLVVEVGARTSGAENKRKKIVGHRTRRPSQQKTVQSSFDDLTVLPLPTPPTFDRPSQRFQSSQEIGEDDVDVELEAKKQAESAKYSFASAVSDTVNDNSQVRKEVRDGLKVSGLYSYSDGFFKRTVFYEADENGYRVVKEESEPIGHGPEFHPDGEIEVNSQQSGSSLRYKIRGDQLRPRKTSKGRESNYRTDDGDRESLPE
ncbi:Insect cuticle protein [Nesidiocoris tenuis]|uniref:Insect cuticle protein n=1 Tax=Nesidiocoris tenuis TaxID=355587 RepID=A0ABN7ADV5_9HEMI|nr:Insect cuticle protein [Nesidiocoris tenuis]